MKIRELFEDGRIVKGVNTTVDVGVNQTQIEAAKYGNRVTRDGFPPTLKASGKVNEALTAYQRAIIEGGHTLEDPRFSFLRELQEVDLNEDIGKRLRQLAAAAGMAATAAGGFATKNAYDNRASQQTPPSVSQKATATAEPKSTQRQLPKRPVSLTPTTVKKSELTPTTSSIRPKARPGSEEETTTSKRPKPRPSLQNLGKYSSYLYNEAVKNGIVGEELVALMAQAAQETAQFTDLDENGGTEYFKMYDPAHAPVKAKELGNTKPGDGEKYKGRGFLHITGKYNYGLVADAFGMPFVDRPELLEDPEIAAKTSVWFWINRVRPKVSNFKNVRSVTKVINPGLHALDNRRQYFKDYTELVSKFGKK
jgi:putative chitinase